LFAFLAANLSRSVSGFKTLISSGRSTFVRSGAFSTSLKSCFISLYSESGIPFDKLLDTPYTLASTACCP